MPKQALLLATCLPTYQPSYPLLLLASMTNPLLPLTHHRTYHNLSARRLLVFRLPSSTYYLLPTCHSSIPATHTCYYPLPLHICYLPDSTYNYYK
jgi:hypothetical protein